MPLSQQRTIPSPVRRPTEAFTLIEVAMAATVLAFGIISSIAVLQHGLRAVDTARNLTTATQVMQSEIERLRLKSWAQLESLQATNDSTVSIDGSLPDGRFFCTRRISTIKIDMKEIALTASWQGFDGRPHTARMITRYCRNGLNDYYYTVH